MELGFSFYWDAGRPPVFVTPTGQVLPLSVVKNIPFLDVGDPGVGLCEPSVYEAVPVAPVLEELHDEGEEEEPFEVEDLCDIDGDVPMPPVEEEETDEPGSTSP